MNHRARSLAGNVRPVARESQLLRHEKVGSPAIVVYSLLSGCGALGVGAVASFAASSVAAKLILWMVVTSSTAIAAGVAYESRWVRGFSHSVIRWIQSVDRPY